MKSDNPVTPASRTPNATHLTKDELREVYGASPVPADLITHFVSCYLGICGTYPYGTRTDEAR